MSDNKCRSKNPSTCPYHGAQLRMDAATKRGDFDAYADARADFEAASVRKDIREGLNSDKEVYSYSSLPIRDNGGANGFSGFANGGALGNEMAAVLSAERDDTFAVDFEHTLNDDGSVSITVSYTPDPSDGMNAIDPDTLRYGDYAEFGLSATDEQIATVVDSFNENAPSPWDSEAVGRVEEEVTANLTEHLHGEVVKTRLGERGDWVITHEVRGDGTVNALQRKAIADALKFEHRTEPWLALRHVRADYEEWVNNYAHDDDED